MTGWFVIQASIVIISLVGAAGLLQSTPFIYDTIQRVSAFNSIVKISCVTVAIIGSLLVRYDSLISQQFLII